MTTASDPRGSTITPFKEGINRDSIAHLAAQVKKAAAPGQSFDANGLVTAATQGLTALALKARVTQVIDALHRQLGAVDPAVAVGWAARAAEHWQADTTQENDDALGVFAAWPLVDYVGAYGRTCPAASLAALKQMTVLFTAEFAIRPFIVDDLAGTLDTLTGWLDDPRPEVRRLVSEGTRPRLPWGLRLNALVADPAPTLPLLTALKDDPSEDVRRSVANHLNDIAKDHPQVVIDTCARWQGPSHDPKSDIGRLVKHALRTLIKAGHAEALALVGVDVNSPVTASDWGLSCEQITLGESLRWSLTLHNPTTTRQSLVVDYRVAHLKQNGGHTTKVFKGATLTLAPGERRTLTRAHALKPISTRRYYAGTHHMEVLVNGQPRGRATFELLM